MSNLKDLTWEHHKNAERQEFVKELLSGAISKERYSTFLYNLYLQYDLLEQFAAEKNILDVTRAKEIYDDFQELSNKHSDEVNLLPVVSDYRNHLYTIKDDTNKLMAHIYVRHMGDLSGGQMIARKVPGEGRMYKFDEDVTVLKERIRERCDDTMAEEARICFDFATQMFREMTEIQ